MIDNKQTKKCKEKKAKFVNTQNTKSRQHCKNSQQNTLKTRQK